MRAMMRIMMLIVLGVGFPIKHWRWKLRPVRRFGKHEHRDGVKADFWEVHRVIWQLSDQDYADYEHLYAEVRGIIFTSANKKWMQWSVQQIQISFRWPQSVQEHQRVHLDLRVTYSSMAHAQARKCQVLFYHGLRYQPRMNTKKCS